MTDLEVVPGERIGPYRIGMDRDEAASAAEAAGMTFERTSVRAIPSGDTAVVGGQIFVYFGARGVAVEVEAALAGPSRITCGGIMLSSAAPKVVAAFNAISQADTSDEEFPATTCYPRLGLCLWMDAKPGEPLTGTFEAVLIRRPTPG